MAKSADFVDVQCHLLSGVDDGPATLEEALALARSLVADGIRTAIVTPHQLGRWRGNTGPEIRRRTTALQTELRRAHIPLTIHPGGDVRIEPQLASLLRKGDVLSLADRKQHVLLELPDELFFPFDVLLQTLRADGLTAILSHPERNIPLQRQPHLLEPLVQAGCLLQITAASLLGGFGGPAQRTAEDLLDRGWVQFVASDAHDSLRRAPQMSPAFERLTSLAGEETAWELCVVNPGRVVVGDRVSLARPGRRRATAGGSRSWLGWAAAALTGRRA